MSWMSQKKLIRLFIQNWTYFNVNFILAYSMIQGVLMIPSVKAHNGLSTDLMFDPWSVTHDSVEQSKIGYIYFLNIPSLTQSHQSLDQ